MQLISASHSPVVEWIKASDGNVPPNAVKVGYDRVAKDVIYIARAYHQGDILPGKLVSSHGCCYVAWGGNEHAYRKYEVLTTPYGDTCEWRFGSYNNIPLSALQGGRTITGEPLYIGCVYHKGSMASGKIHPSHKVLYVPYGGKEHAHERYRILVRKNFST